MATASTAQLTKTRKELRQLIADELGDLMQLTATANGSTTTFVDTIRLAPARESLIGRQWVGTSGSNDGEIRGVTAGTTTLTLSAAVTSTVAGDTADLYNLRGIGWTYEEYNRVVNATIEEATGFGLIEVLDASHTAFDADSPELTVDASIAYVFRVEYQDGDGIWHAIPAAKETSHYGWKPDSVGGSIWILGEPARWADTNPIQIWGYGRQATLSADTDACALNPSWVVARACYRLCRSGMARSDETAQKVLLFKEESERLSRRMVTYWNPAAKKVRTI